jgi:hypothetical protein
MNKMLGGLFAVGALKLDSWADWASVSACGATLETAEHIRLTTQAAHEDRQQGNDTNCS